MSWLEETKSQYYIDSMGTEDYTRSTVQQSNSYSYEYGMQTEVQLFISCMNKEMQYNKKGKRKGN